MRLRRATVVGLCVGLGVLFALFSFLSKPGMPSWTVLSLLTLLTDIGLLTFFIALYREQRNALRVKGEDEDVHALLEIPPQDERRQPRVDDKAQAMRVSLGIPLLLQLVLGGAFLCQSIGISFFLPSIRSWFSGSLTGVFLFLAGLKDTRQNAAFFTIWFLFGVIPTTLINAVITSIWYKQRSWIFLLCRGIGVALVAPVLVLRIITVGLMSNDWPAELLPAPVDYHHGYGRAAGGWAPPPPSLHPPLHPGPQAPGARPPGPLPSGSSGQITGVAFSADGKLLATSGEDWAVRLWDAATVKEVASLQGHTDAVLSVAFSPDGKTVASGSRDGTARLWDVAALKDSAILGGHTGFVRSVAFSPDGKILATGSWDRTIKLWDTETRVQLGTLSGHTDPVKSVAFSPDGMTLASGSMDSTVRLWDVAQQKELGKMQGHEAQVLSVAFGRDSELLVSGSEDRTVRLWDVPARKERGVLHGHANLVWSVAFSPEGRTLASADEDGVVKLWDVALETEKAEFRAPARVYSVCFSPDGRKLAGAGSSGGFQVGVVWKGKASAPAAPQPKPLNLWDVPQESEALPDQADQAPPDQSEATAQGEREVSVEWVINPANGHEYCLLPVMSWPEAQAAAERLGGALVTVNDDDENSWLVSTFGFSPYWIGLNDVASEGSFVWAGGEIASYQNWAPGEPNNGASTGEQDWVIINYAQPGQWDDQYSNNTNAGIVERIKQVK